MSYTNHLFNLPTYLLRLFRQLENTRKKIYCQVILEALVGQLPKKIFNLINSLRLGALHIIFFLVDKRY